MLSIFAFHVGFCIHYNSGVEKTACYGFCISLCYMSLFPKFRSVLRDIKGVRGGAAVTFVVYCILAIGV